MRRPVGDPTIVRDTRRKPYVPPAGYDLNVKLLRVAKLGGNYSFVNPDQVWMIRAAEKMVTYFLDDGEVVYGDRGISAVLEQFPGKWIRVHRSCAVRQADIVRIDRGQVKLANGEVCTISRRQFLGLFERSVSINGESSRGSKAREASWSQVGLS